MAKDRWCRQMCLWYCTVLHNQLECGVHDSHIQHLLSEPVITLETRMKIALGMESAAQNVITFHRGGEASTV